MVPINLRIDCFVTWGSLDKSFYGKFQFRLSATLSSMSILVLASRNAYNYVTLHRLQRIQRKWVLFKLFSCSLRTTELQKVGSLLSDLTVDTEICISRFESHMLLHKAKVDCFSLPFTGLLWLKGLEVLVYTFLWCSSIGSVYSRRTHRHTHTYTHTHTHTYITVPFTASSVSLAAPAAPAEPLIHVPTQNTIIAQSCQSLVLAAAEADCFASGVVRLRWELMCL